jgi:mono/diheme cytochrome c family protein
MSGFLKYFLLPFVLVVIVVVAIAGPRGGTSRKPPIELFPDMDRQPKLRPQTYNAILPNNFSSQPYPEGTIARNAAFEDKPLNTGRETGSTNWVEVNPMPITESLLNRGQERYNISCSPCHSPVGDGKGITGKYGMVAMANFHDKRLVTMADGEIFNTITYGKNLMGAYGGLVAVEDRWAIVAYVRALQRSRLAYTDELPAGVQSTLKK